MNSFDDFKRLMEATLGWGSLTDAEKFFGVAMAQRAWEYAEKAEREACAKVCDAMAESGALAAIEKYRAEYIANEIRGRSNATPAQD